MQITKITDTYSVADQISVADIPLIKARGFQVIMCNRPDGEEFGQPEVEIIRQAVGDHGLKFYFVPMAHTGLGPTTLHDFTDVITQETGPILAYCRTGNRCTMLWNATQN